MTSSLRVEFFCYTLWKGTKWTVTCDFQQCGILTWIDSDEPVQPPLNLRSSKWCAFSSLTFIEYSSDKQRLWSDCAYAQADLRLCWSHIPHCWKSHVTAQIWNLCQFALYILRSYTPLSSTFLALRPLDNKLCETAFYRNLITVQTILSNKKH